ncbi:MAG: hypothetical protein LC791_16880 [Acidobacteria bacterium]|nr:hypothetical protein [Acidobacteriota bacterium]
MFEAHRRLAGAVRRLDVAVLDEPVIDHRTDDPVPGAGRDDDGRDRATGIGLSKYLTLHGLVHHSVYHAGQIALVRKLLGGSALRRGLPLRGGWDRFQSDRWDGSPCWPWD